MDFREKEIRLNGLLLRVYQIKSVSQLQKGERERERERFLRRIRLLHRTDQYKSAVRYGQSHTIDDCESERIAADYTPNNKMGLLSLDLQNSSPRTKFKKLINLLGFSNGIASASHRVVGCV